MDNFLWVADGLTLAMNPRSIVYGIVISPANQNWCAITILCNGAKFLICIRIWTK